MRYQVALWGLPADEPLEAVRVELIRRSVPHVVIDQRDRCHPVELDAIGALFVRVCETAPLQRHLFAWADVAECFVMNRPSTMWSNWTKPLQAELICSHGFAVPATLVTTTPDDVREFVTQYARVVYKAVSGHRSVVSRLDRADFDHLADVATCPTQFQEFVPGVDWRVHVVGDAVFACEIRCDADDYRLAHVAGEKVELRSAALPDSIAARCRTLTRELGLSLAGIDLRRTENDVWYCFEVNTAPGFTFFEPVAQPVAAAVAALLANACMEAAA
jgi:glutathione synthase/RimK-type ligase-like ATP-grasp enzyme